MGTARAEQLRKRLAQGLAARPVLRGTLRALGAGGFCFVLAGAGLLDGPVPRKGSGGPDADFSTMDSLDVQKRRKSSCGKCWFCCCAVYSR